MLSPNSIVGAHGNPAGIVRDSDQCGINDARFIASIGVMRMISRSFLSLTAESLAKSVFKE